MNKLPKAELHVHLEGTVSPEMAAKLAKRNNIPLPDNIFNAEGDYNWNDFPEFIGSYDVASSVLRTPQDFTDITYDYLASIANDGGIYVELAVAPDIPLMMGMDFDTYIGAVAKGIEKAKEEFGIESRMIMTAVRHMGAETAENLAKLTVKKNHPLVAGFGLAGNEAAFEPKDFAEAFRIAHEEGGLACTAHAGEVRGPESIKNAIDALPVSRIGHGVRAIEDPALMKELANRGITLEICPNSNIALHVYPDFASHPLRKLYDAGIVGSLNSDDPPFFWTSLNQEYETAAEHFGFTEKELVGLTKRAITTSFADEKTKVALLKRVDAMMKERGSEPCKSACR